ncbi:MAG: 4Fe-4S dicluster domain-containing protein [Bryobacteraceae bacterium]|nr:4Fe-4S dicluster domain-containing protein [Bryobacteraceae bacterium]
MSTETETTAQYVKPGRHADAPTQKDLDRCVHCGLCLNACPTYRELGVEMDSPRGRIYQMVQVATGQVPLNPVYTEHMDLCLGCRACETACPSGVEYGKLIEAARTELNATRPKSFFRRTLEGVVFGHLLGSRWMLSMVGSSLWLYQATGLQSLVRATGILKLLGLAEIEKLTPVSERPTFFGQLGKVFPAEGAPKKKVALLAGCMQNVFFARLNEATVRVLQKNGCEVHVVAEQTCCGALHAHSGFRDEARALARQNIDAMVDGGFDAIISNTGGCGATLKEYDHLLEHDAAYAPRAQRFVGLMRDVNEFLASLDLNLNMKPIQARVTYQDSCHLAHGQKVTKAPRQLIARIPGITLVEMPNASICCGSAGIYNVVQNELAMEILSSKMGNVNLTKADRVISSNPGCMLQLRAGEKLHGQNRPVQHVVELLDEAYRA